MPANDADELDDISPHVRIRIDPSKKKQWLDYADEHGLSLTDLIKEAVDNTLNDTWVLAGEAEPEEPATVNVDTGKIEDDLQEVLSRLDAFETQLDGVTLQESGDHTTEYLDRSDLISLANRCHDHLPKAADGDQLIELTSQVLVPEETEIPKLTGLAHDIAVVLEESEQHVRQALIFLEREQNANISSIIHDGVRRWYEVDPTLDIDEVLEGVDEGYPVEFESGTEFEGQ